MSEIDTQLRDYFDASVERVTPEDILARQRVTEMIRPDKPQKTMHPARAAVGAFVATVVVLGGAIALGAVVKGPTDDDVGSSGLTGLVRDATNAAGGWWLPVAAIGVAVGGGVAVIVRNRPRRGEQDQEEEDSMATTIEAPPAAETGTAQHSNRGLVVTIVVLAVALLALGAWVLYSQTTEAETAAPAEVQDLFDDYTAAWNTYDGDAFTALTTEYYVHINGGNRSSRAVMAAGIGGGTLEDLSFHVEQVGDAVVTGDGPYYVAIAYRTTSSGTEPDPGIASFIVVETDDGLKVAEHTWVGE